MAERPEDLNLPTPVVSKLISDCLPPNCKVTEEAKVAITKVKSWNSLYFGFQGSPSLLIYCDCLKYQGITITIQAASVFVLYATSQANSMAHNQSRKTIHGQDVITAMNEMEFEKFVRPLENSLASTYRWGHFPEVKMFTFQFGRKVNKKRRNRPPRRRLRKRKPTLVNPIFPRLSRSTDKEIPKNQIFCCIIYREIHIFRYWYYKPS